MGLDDLRGDPVSRVQKPNLRLAKECLGFPDLGPVAKAKPLQLPAQGRTKVDSAAKVTDGTRARDRQVNWPVGVLSDFGTSIADRAASKPSGKVSQLDLRQVRPHAMPRSRSSDI